MILYYILVYIVIDRMYNKKKDIMNMWVEWILKKEMNLYNSGFF